MSRLTQAVLDSKVFQIRSRLRKFFFDLHTKQREIQNLFTNLQQEWIFSDQIYNLRVGPDSLWGEGRFAAVCHNWTFFGSLCNL